MNADASGSPIDFAMFAILRAEAEGQAQVLVSGLLELERDPTAATVLQGCMRAAHSLKGACRIVGLTAGVEVAHAIEDCFAAVREGRVPLDRARIDLVLRGVDLLTRMAQSTEGEIGKWTGKLAEVDAFVTEVARFLQNDESADPEQLPPKPQTKGEKEGKEVPAPAVEAGASDRVLRVTAENLNHLLALSGESVVEASRIKPFARMLFRLKRLQAELAAVLENARPDRGGTGAGAGTVEAAWLEAKRRAAECQQFLLERLAELDGLDYRASDLSRRLYDEALAIRMRPFADGLQGFHRLVRDLGHSLGKRARLEIAGEGTWIDRDILEQLKAPLDHLLRNAVDHGIEPPEDRLSAGKPAEGVVLLEARHSAGTLQITVSDDGRGIDPDRIRAAVVERRFADAETARSLSEAELLEFLFLPGFTMKGEVTEISGRGVGLDVVRNMVREVRGTARVSTSPGGGARFHLQLPLTLSVIRSLLVEIGGEPYAFPLARVLRTMKVTREKIESLEGRPHAAFDGKRIGLVAARQALGGEAGVPADGELSVVVVGEAAAQEAPGALYGLVVDRFLGEREMVIQPLDARLGKIRDIAAGALTEDGLPVLVIDTEDLVRSVEKLVASGRPEGLRRAAADRKRRKRILVVDDSLTVRELERKLLGNWGYEVEVAVDGMDGWNAVRSSRFDLVVSDIDMPRLDGIELVHLIKRDPNLKALPVMIVSYKDREEDRRRGLEAGADYYLAKSSFQEETLLQAVIDLIGPADA